MLHKLFLSTFTAMKSLSMVCLCKVKLGGRRRWGSKGYTWVKNNEFIVGERSQSSCQLSCSALSFCPCEVDVWVDVNSCTAAVLTV